MSFDDKTCKEILNEIGDNFIEFYIKYFAKPEAKANITQLTDITKENTIPKFQEFLKTEKDIEDHPLTYFEIPKIINQEGKICASGGFKKVHLGFDITANEPIAISRFGHIENENEKKRFDNEICIMKKLNNPFLLKIKLFNENEHYFITKYYNTDIYTITKNYGKTFWKKDELRKLLINMCNALIELKRKCIIHRDIKPENILFDEKEKKYVLIDFGLSTKYNEDSTCSINSITRTDKLLSNLGTLNYISPEQFLDTSYTYSSDVFSLGMTIVTIITSMNPYMYCLPRIFPKTCKKYKKTKDRLKSLFLWETNVPIKILDYLHSSCHTKDYPENTIRILDASEKEQTDFENLLRNMIDIYINKRLSIEQILEHPFLQQPKLEPSDVTVALPSTTVALPAVPVTLPLPPNPPAVPVTLPLPPNPLFSQQLRSNGGFKKTRIKINYSHFK
jgi:serine/threonine protein kinase